MFRKGLQIVFLVMAVQMNEIVQLLASLGWPFKRTEENKKS